MRNYDYDGSDAYYPVKKQQDVVEHWHPNMAHPNHPYQLTPRPESIIDLNFKRSREEKIIALSAIARMHNTLGKTFVLKRKFLFAIEHLTFDQVKFVVEDGHEIVEHPETAH